MLYVNNIRAYYNILKWLTENEAPRIEEYDPSQHGLPEPGEAAEEEAETQA